MKLVVTTLITLGAAVGFALLALEDPGYVVLARAPYSMRLPLALFVLLAVAAFAVLYLFFNLLASVFRAPERLRRWRKKRAQSRAQSDTIQGYAGLIEGDWLGAEKKLLLNLRDNPSTLLNYLGAAYAAQQQGNPQRRNDYLDAALAQHPRQRLAIGLTRARLHYQSGEIAECRETLEQLRRISPKNAPAARLLADVYREQRDWNALAALMPTLARLKAFPPGELAARERAAYSNYLALPAVQQSDERMQQALKSLPANRRKEPGVIAAYCAKLLASGEPARAEKTLRKALNQQWDAQLATLYGQVETDSVGDQILLAESWAKKYGALSHPALTLTLARLYRRNRELHKAKELLVKVVDDGREDARADLGEVLESLGDTEGALRCYRQGIAAPVTGTEAGAEAAAATENDADTEVMPVMPVVKPAIPSARK